MAVIVMTSVKICENFSRAKTLVFVVVSAVYRVMSERIIMFVKIMNRFFGGASFEVLTAVL